MLIIDDDRGWCSQLVQAFAPQGYELRCADDGQSALSMVRERPPDLALVELHIPGCHGGALLRELRRISPGTKTVVLTAYGSIASAIEALRLGVINYLVKPANPEEILAAFHPDEAPTATAPLPVPSLARAEWEHIHRVLSDCQGNIARTAALLGLHRRTLQRKLGKYAPSR